MGCMPRKKISSLPKWESPSGIAHDLFGRNIIRHDAAAASVESFKETGWHLWIACSQFLRNLSGVRTPQSEERNGLSGFWSWYPCLTSGFNCPELSFSQPANRPRFFVTHHSGRSLVLQIRYHLAGFDCCPRPTEANAASVCPNNLPKGCSE